MRVLISYSVSTALPTLGRVFNDASTVSWVGTSYLLTSTAFQPLYGRLSDIFGRKVILLGCLSIFLVGSILCAISQSMIMLIVFRRSQPKLYVLISICLLTIVFASRRHCWSWWGRYSHSSDDRDVRRGLPGQARHIPRHSGRRCRGVQLYWSINWWCVLRGCFMALVFRKSSCCWSAALGEINVWTDHLLPSYSTSTFP